MIKDNFALRIYSRVAHLGSFSAAARECGVSQSQASRIVADLEATLAARLLTRTTRAVVPTEAGRAFLARIEPILLALEEAEQSVREGGALRGRLRISMPTSLGVREVIPRLAPFAERHPDLLMEFRLGDYKHDPVRAAVDVALRLGRLDNAGATVRLMASIPRIVVASPGYLAKHGIPETPEALDRHRIVGGPASAVPTAWRFHRDGRETVVKLEPNFSTDQNEGTIAAAVADLGVTSINRWSCQRELDDGALVRLLPEWTLAAIPLHAYFPMARATRAAARAAIDHLAGDLERNPPVAAGAAGRRPGRRGKGPEPTDPHPE